MNLWGATPLLLAALLGGFQHGTKPAPAPASIASTSVVLSQVGSGQWQTTLLLNAPVGAKCPIRSDFALQTSARRKPFAPIERHQAPSLAPYCRRITLTFRGPKQIPVSAVLVLRAPGPAVSSVPVSFSRPVGMGLYYVVPAITGLVMLLALLLCALIFVRVHDRFGVALRPFRLGKRMIRSNGAFWQWTVTASGAWTINDSWATNISTVTAIVTTLLGATGAASTIFPGIALDRFAFVNMLVAGLIAAVPLGFAILYARWTARFPGPTSDTIIAPQIPLAKGYEVILRDQDPDQGPDPDPVTVRWRRRLRRGRDDLPAGTRVRLRQKGAFAIVTDGSPVSLAPAPEPGPQATLASGTVIAPVPGAPAALATAIRAHSPVAANTQVRLSQAAMLRPAEQFLWTWVRSGEDAILVAGLPAAPPAVPVLPAGTRVRLAAGAMATFGAAPAMTGVSPQGREATLPGDIKASVPQRAGGVPAGAKTRFRRRLQVALTGPGTAGQDVLNQDPAITGDAVRTVVVTAPGGATITLPGGGALGAIEYPDTWPVQAKDGTAIQAPPGSRIDILAARQITVPGGSDLLVGGESALRITSQGNLTAVAASSVAPALKPPPVPQEPQGLMARILERAGHADDGKPDPADIPVPCPVFLTAPAGAKITVAGTADVELPAGLAMMAPRRRYYVLKYDRHLTVPAPAGTLGASMRLVIVAALLTVFGVGAQLGIAGVLAYFSDASTTGRWVAFGLLGAVAAFLLYYSTTAIRSLADPQPGSSLSAVPGTSFTL
jgi:hypothetical protein